MFKSLIEKYKTVKKDFLSRSPRGKWEFSRNIGIFVLTLTGVPVLDPNYKVSWYSYAPLLTCLDIFISFFYTIWYFIETPLTGILVTPLFGVVVPVIKLKSILFLIKNDFFFIFFKYKISLHFVMYW